MIWDLVLPFSEIRMGSVFALNPFSETRKVLGFGLNPFLWNPKEFQVGFKPPVLKLERVSGLVKFFVSSTRKDIGFGLNLFLKREIRKSFRFGLTPLESRKGVW